MERFKAFWSTLPTPSKAIAVVVVIVAALFLMGGVGGLVSVWKDSRFDKREAERETQRQQLETERNLAVGRAEAAEARAKELEASTRILEVTASAFGQRAEKVKEQITDEEKRLEAELAGLDDGADACTRLIRLCERAKSLGLYPKSKACTCE